MSRIVRAQRVNVCTDADADRTVAAEHNARMRAADDASASAHVDLEAILRWLPTEQAEQIRGLVNTIALENWKSGNALARFADARVRAEDLEREEQRKQLA